MKVTTAALFVTVLLLVLASGIFFHFQHAWHLHHSGGQAALISKKDHDHFLAEGIHCEEVYHTQGYEGPEALLRQFSLTRHQFHELNPGVSMDSNPAGTAICIKGKPGVTEETTHHFVWFYPITGACCVGMGLIASWAIRRSILARPPSKQHIEETGAAQT